MPPNNTKKKANNARAATERKAAANKAKRNAEKAKQSEKKAAKNAAAAGAPPPRVKPGPAIVVSAPAPLLSLKEQAAVARSVGDMRTAARLESAAKSAAAPKPRNVGYSAAERAAEGFARLNEREVQKLHGSTK